MKIARYVWQFALATVLPGSVFAQQQPNAASEIAASGTAEIRIAPDHAVLATTVETRDRTATAATSTNNSAASAIMQALRKAGLPASAVSTSNFTVDQYFPPRFDPRESQIPDGFITRTTIRAETDNVALVSSLVDAALSAGATRIGVSFSSSKLPDARRSGLDAAFTAARADADALARSAGGTLGRLLSASPNGSAPATLFRSIPDYSGGIAYGTITSAAAMIPPTSMTSNVVVSARWEFIPGAAH